MKYVIFKYDLKSINALKIVFDITELKAGTIFKAKN